MVKNKHERGRKYASKETLKRLPEEMQEMYELFRQNLERRM